MEGAVVNFLLMIADPIKDDTGFFCEWSTTAFLA
jgi:hypothetical protein